MKRALFFHSTFGIHSISLLVSETLEFSQVYTFSFTLPQLGDVKHAIYSTEKESEEGVSLEHRSQKLIREGNKYGLQTFRMLDFHTML